MTNVGKIYKPELRLLAAQAVAGRLVAGVCHAAGVNTLPQLHLDVTQQRVVVRIDDAALGDAAPALHAQLQAALEPWPFKFELSSR